MILIIFLDSSLVRDLTHRGRERIAAPWARQRQVVAKGRVEKIKSSLPDATIIHKFYSMRERKEIPAQDQL